MSNERIKFKKHVEQMGFKLYEPKVDKVKSNPIKKSKHNQVRSLFDF